jgi:uncharacterized protein YndB with AHSA1/START domain
MSNDRIEKQVVLHAPRSRVWRAIANAEEFGSWFGVSLEAGFKAGARVKGRITTQGYTHLSLEIVVEQVEPDHLLSYRWHPYAIDSAVDYSGETMTLVELRLDEVEGGTQLTVVESGFDRIPLARRAEAFRMNDGGRAEQMKNIERHVAA